MDFEGDSVIFVCDRAAILLAVGDNGLLAGFRTDYAATYDDEDPEDWEHVFTILPTPLLIPVVGADLVARTPRGSAGRPVQLSALILDELPPAPGLSTDPYFAEYEALGPVVRVPRATVLRRIRDGAIADTETLALLHWYLHAAAAADDARRSEPRHRP